MAFQSTLPRGSDHEKRGAEPIPVSFQSTLPRGSDLRLHYAISVQRRDFNPRSLAGATPSVKGREQAGEISIHAPSRERQQVIARRQRAYRHFNPRSLAGATRSPGGGRRWRIISIHAPSRERRSIPVNNGRTAINFNPRSLAGATHFPIMIFSPRH